MTAMNVHDAHVSVLSRLLDVASLRHQVIAQNVANVNTPGYRQLDVEFEAAFGQALSSQNTRPAESVKAGVVEGVGGAERADGNNVDIDQEMGRLGKNSLLYRLYGQLLAARLASMRSAITGR